MRRPLSRSEIALGAALVALLALVLGILAFHEVPEKNQTLFTSLASGIVGAGVLAMINFVWGSSNGQQKDPPGGGDQ